DSEGKPTMGYMYSEIDRAKEKIKDAFQSVKASPNFKVEYDVKKGLYDCLDILVGDPALITIIDSQLEDFKVKAKFFGRDVAKNALKTKTPSQWWDS
ncbi:hypothetical protein HN51_066859, partial [Arachis hypogaea]